MATHHSQHYHLNLGPASRSALARANVNLDPDFYQKLFYQLYERCQQTGAVPWVTRAKINMKYEVIKSYPVKKGTGVVSDQRIRLSSEKALKANLPYIRRVEFVDADTDKCFVFITNQVDWSARTVADLQVLMGGRTVLQMGQAKPEDSKCAWAHHPVATQVFVAQCVYLLMAYLKFVCRAAFSVQAALRLLQMSLFLRWPIEQLLHKSMREPPDPRITLSLRCAQVGQQ